VPLYHLQRHIVDLRFIGKDKVIEEFFELSAQKKRKESIKVFIKSVIEKKKQAIS
jgi:hypothetical protein